MDQGNHFDLLSNLNADNQVDNIDRDFVNERALKAALFQASKAPNTIDIVYERVTGKTPNWQKPQETVEQFQASLRIAMSVIKQLGGGNAGLDVLLQGKTDKFLEEVAKKVAANKNKPLEIKIEDSKNLSPTMHNMLGIAGTVGIAILSQGIVVAGHENSIMESDDFIKKEESDKEGGFWNTLGSAATWVKEAFLGRRLSFTVF